MKHESWLWASSSSDSVTTPDVELERGVRVTASVTSLAKWRSPSPQHRQKFPSLGCVSAAASALVLVVLASLQSIRKVRECANKSFHIQRQPSLQFFLVSVLCVREFSSLFLAASLVPVPRLCWCSRCYELYKCLCPMLRLAPSTSFGMPRHEQKTKATSTTKPAPCRSLIDPASDAVRRARE
jgi:hypothetical protein